MAGAGIEAWRTTNRRNSDSEQNRQPIMSRSRPKRLSLGATRGIEMSCRSDPPQELFVALLRRPLPRQRLVPVGQRRVLDTCVAVYPSDAERRITRKRALCSQPEGNGHP